MSDSQPVIPRTTTREYVRKLTEQVEAMKEGQVATAEELRFAALEAAVSRVDKLLHRAVAGAFALTLAVVTAAGGGVTVLLQQRDAASRRDERAQLMQLQIQRLEDRFDGRVRYPAREDSP